jgi:hypothetical protein
MAFKLTTKYFILFVLFCTISCANAQSYKHKARNNLQKWGIAYCMSKTSSESRTNALYGNAQAAYFELGSHSDEAYQEIKKFIDEYISIPYQGKEFQDLSIQKCLDLVHDNAYNSRVKYCDRWLIKK